MDKEHQPAPASRYRMVKALAWLQRAHLKERAYKPNSVAVRTTDHFTGMVILQPTRDLS